MGNSRNSWNENNSSRVVGEFSNGKAGLQVSRSNVGISRGVMSKYQLFALVATVLLDVGVATQGELVVEAQAKAFTSPEIEQVVFSVKDLARSEEIYTAVLGFQVRGRGEGPSSTLERLWSLPPGKSM